MCLFLYMLKYSSKISQVKIFSLLSKRFFEKILLRHGRLLHDLLLLITGPSFCLLSLFASNIVTENLLEDLSTFGLVHPPINVLILVGSRE